MDSLVAENRPLLHFDLGDFTKVDQVTGDFETRFIWDTFERARVNAVSPGPRELTAWSTFQALMDRGTIPVISSNLALKTDGGEVPIGSRYRIFEVNGVRVAVFALMGGGEFAGVRGPESVQFAFSDPFQTAADLVPELRKQADVVVLLSQMQTADTDRLVQSLPGIDVALYGQRPLWEQMASKSGETILNRTGSRGQYMGQLVLIVSPEGDIVDWGSRNAPMDDPIYENEEVARLAAEAEEKAKQMRAQARETQQTEFEHRLSGERFLGAENCKRCHAQQYDQWAESPHAHAFASLQHPVEGKALTQECVQCHVTGFGDPTGFRPDLSRPDWRPASKPDMANVQCESCHFKGSEHVRTGTVQITEATCKGCHTAEWSPGFDFDKAILAVKH